jgi:metal-responsive CopG/Arc/MetJ family transcriptional regulator
MRKGTKITTMRMPRELLTDLGRIAAREGRSRSNLITHVLAAYAAKARKFDKRAATAVEAVDVLD